MNYRILYITLILLNIELIKAVTVNALAFIFIEKIHLFNSLIKAYNNYANENKLNITLNLTILTPNNSTIYINNYGSTIDSFLNRHSNEYDIYFYYYSYKKKYSSHFLNLSEYLPKEHIDMFDNIIIKNSCLYGDQVVGLPVMIDIDVLYSNKKLLLKYGKKIPKTWDELIEISKYILNEEKKLNNTNLIAYNGLFCESDEGFVSIYELIHSFRDSKFSEHPEIKSEKTVDSLKMIKRIKNEISSDSLFLSKDEFTINKLISGNAIFLKFWYLKHNSVYETSALPGWKEGVSGTIIGGYNIGISKYSEKSKRKAVVEVLKFITSKNVQKEHIIKNHIFSGISSLYNEEDVCEIINCDIVKNIQPFPIVNLNTGKYDIDYYIEKYRSYIFEYIYGNRSISEVVKKIDDLTRYYFLSISPEDSYIGIVIITLFSVILMIMILSLILIFIKHLKTKFQFLPYDFWIISVLGSFIYLCSILTLYGKMTNFRCQLRTFFFSFGFILSLIPFLYILIIYYKDNPISKWIIEHRYKFISVFISIIFLCNLLIFISPYDIINVVVLNGENFQKCEMHDALGINLLFFIIFLNTILIISVFLLIYMEWNNIETYYYARFLTTSIIMDILSMIIFGIFSYIEINNYIVHYTILACNIYTFSISNYIFIFGVVLITPPIYINDMELKDRIKSNNNNIYFYKSNTSTSSLSSYSITSEY